MDLLAIAKNIADRVEAESSRVNVPVSVSVVDTRQHRSGAPNERGVGFLHGAFSAKGLHLGARAGTHGRHLPDGSAGPGALSPNVSGEILRHGRRSPDRLRGQGGCGRRSERGNCRAGRRDPRGSTSWRLVEKRTVAARPPSRRSVAARLCQRSAVAKLRAAPAARTTSCFEPTKGLFEHAGGPHAWYLRVHGQGPPWAGEEDAHTASSSRWRQFFRARKDRH